MIKQINKQFLLNSSHHWVAFSHLMKSVQFETPAHIFSPLCWFWIPMLIHLPVLSVSRCMCQPLVHRGTKGFLVIAIKYRWICSHKSTFENILSVKGIYDVFSYGECHWYHYSFTFHFSNLKGESQVHVLACSHMPTLSRQKIDHLCQISNASTLYIWSWVLPFKTSRQYLFFLPNINAESML